MEVKLHLYVCCQKKPPSIREKDHFNVVLAEKQLGGTEEGKDISNSSSLSPTHASFDTLTPDPDINN